MKEKHETDWGAMVLKTRHSEQLNPRAPSRRLKPSTASNETLITTDTTRRDSPMRW